MKRLTFLFAFLGFALAWAQPLSDGNYLIPVDHVWGLPKYLDLKAVYPADYYPILGVLYKGYYILDNYASQGRILVYSERDERYGDDGYCYVSRGYDDRIEPLILLFGGDTVIPVGEYIYAQPEKTLRSSDHNWHEEYFFAPKLGNSWLESKEEYTDRSWLESYAGPWDDGIKSIRAWSTLTETIKGESVTYDAKRTRFPFYSFYDAELNFNNASLFWAEGDPGPGIGGTIDVAFKHKADHVMILNGAVDLARLNLYKDNNRLRRVRVGGDDGAFSIEYTFEDHVQFHKISFPKEVSKIRITILDVYKGKKWDDTCVTAIFLKQPPLRPRSEYDKVIETYIRKRGFDKLIEEYERASGRTK